MACRGGRLLSHRYGIMPLRHQPRVARRGRAHDGVKFVQRNCG